MKNHVASNHYSTDMDLKEAKSKLREEVKENGTATCPCCAQTVRMDRVEITPRMCHLLRAWFDKFGRDFGNVKEAFDEPADQTEFRKLFDWVFIEQNVGVLGWYKITDLGMDFLNDEVQAPEWYVIYNGKIHKEPEKHLLCSEILAKAPEPA